MKVWETDTHWFMNSPRSEWGAIDIPKDGRWTFNGDYDNPTFSPSVNFTWGKEGQSMADFKF